jgi:hypothetical protein
MDKLDQILQQIKNQKAKTGEIETPEIRSLYDDFLCEVNEFIELNSIKMSPQENVQSLLGLVCKFGKALAKKPEFNAESRELEVCERNLRLFTITSPNQTKVRQIETALYCIVESKPELRKLYDDVIEGEVLEIWSSKLCSLEELSRERSLSEDELNQMQAARDQVAKSRAALKADSPET